MGYAVGIDLGTSNSVVAAVVGGRPVVIPDEEGNRIHPSVVSFGYGASVVVGARAKEQLIYNPTNTVYSSKRLIGRGLESDAVLRAGELMPYEILAGENGDPRIQVQDRVFSMQEIGAFILRHLRQQAERYLGEPVDRAVITVPAYFSDSQRQATRDAGVIAGLEVMRIINEPTAAALAYGLDKSLNQSVAVYDLGGGTFDISVLRIEDDVFEVVSTAGDTYLGGDDFDWKLVEHLAEVFSNRQGINIGHSATARQKLKEAAEQAKIDLSEKDLVEIHIPGLVKDDHGVERDLETTLSRIQYNQLVFPLTRRSFQVCDEALEAAGSGKQDIGAVVMVGGMTRSPLIRESVESYFGKRPVAGVNPDEVVSVGAAVLAHSLSQAQLGKGSSTLLIDVTPQSLGLEVAGGYVESLIGRNSSIPCRSERRFSTSYDNQTRIEIKVLQGESRMAVDNEILGTFALEDLPAGPRGDVRVQIVFEIDPNGILNVSAVDEESGRRESLRIQASTNLERRQVKDMATRFEELDF